VAILLSSIGQPLVGGCSFYALNIPYPAAGRKGELLFIPTNLHNQIRQIGSRREPAKTCCPWIYDGLAAGDTPTKPNISAYTTGTQAGQVRARAAGVQDHRQQDRPGAFLLSGKTYKTVHKKRTTAGCREKQNKKGFCLLPGIWHI